MKQLVLELPGTGRVQGYPFLKPELSGASLGTLITEFFSLALLIAGVLMFFWFIWGVFDYIFAEGNKENLGKARKKMTWAIVGFILFTLSFAVSQYASTLLKPQTINLPKTIERDSSSINSTHKEPTAQATQGVNT